jgi:hypothetical protein
MGAVIAAAVSLVAMLAAEFMLPEDFGRLAGQVALPVLAGALVVGAIALVFEVIRRTMALR